MTRCSQALLREIATARVEAVEAGECGSAGRVPAVYLKLAFCAFSAFLPFRRISKSRIIKKGLGLESHPLRHPIGLYQHTGVLPLPRPAQAHTPFLDREMDQRAIPTPPGRRPSSAIEQGARALRFPAPKFRAILPPFMNLQVAAGSADPRRPIRSRFQQTCQVFRADCGGRRLSTPEGAPYPSPWATPGGERQARARPALKGRPKPRRSRPPFRASGKKDRPLSAPYPGRLSRPAG